MKKICLKTAVSTILFALSPALFSQLTTAVYPGRIGINIGLNERGVGTFVDAARITDRYNYLEGGMITAEDRDENGWPKVDFQLVLMDNRPTMEWEGVPDDPEVYRVDMSGIYKCSFQGQANIGAGDAVAWTIENKVYDEFTNTTTFDLSVAPPGPHHGLVVWRFTDTRRTAESPVGSGITDLKVIRPGYLDRPDQLFTDEFLSCLSYGHFSTVRAMDFTGTVGNDVVYPGTIEWRDRKKTSDMTCGSLPSRYGHAPWEYFIEICNLVQADMWINIPVAASDDYVTQLARLIRDNLNPELKVYVENDNEVWGFENQRNYNQAQAKDLGLSEEENYARRALEFGRIFADEFGAGSLNERVGVILCWHSPRLDDVQGMMRYIAANFGAPKDHVYAIACQTYFYAYQGDVSELLDRFHSAIADLRTTRLDWMNVAKKWQLPGGWCSYEGGPHGEIGDTSNHINFILANRDPSFGAEMRYNFLDQFIELGGNLAMQFTMTSSYSRYGCWGLTDDVRYPDRNFKFKAIREILGESTAPQPPLDFHVAELSAIKIDLSWTDNSTGEDGFVIERRDDDGDFTEIARVGADVTCYSDDMLTGAGRYSYRLSAVNIDGFSTYSRRLKNIMLPFDQAMVVQPRYVTLADPEFRDADGAINGTGLSDPSIVETGDPVPDAYPVHNTSTNHAWQAGSGDSALVIFDLGQPYTLTGFHLWNENSAADAGARAGAVRAAVSLGKLTSADAVPFLFAKSSGEKDYSGDNYFFPAPVYARYVRFDIYSSWGGARAPGFSEIRFLANVPEETTAPSAPSDVAVSDLTPISVTLSWKNSIGPRAIAEYEVFVGRTSFGRIPGTEMIVSGLVPGTTYDFNVMALDIGGYVSDLSAPVSITTPAVSGEAFLEHDGLLSVEAEHFVSALKWGSQRWRVATTPAGSSGDNSIMAYPDRNGVYDEFYVHSTPRADYLMKFSQTGTYYVWARGTARGEETNDSFHAGLDGFSPPTLQAITFNSADDWVWSNTSERGDMATVEIETPGLHYFNVWFREDGAYIDKILLTTDAGYIPAEFGPEESQMETVTAVESVSAETAGEFELEANYPNPFNPVTRIRYHIPRTCDVSLQVFDVLGRRVETLVQEKKTTGRYEVFFDASKLASGVYFARMQAAEFIGVKKMIYAK